MKKDPLQRCVKGLLALIIMTAALIALPVVWSLAMIAALIDEVHRSLKHRLAHRTNTPVEGFVRSFAEKGKECEKCQRS